MPDLRTLKFYQADVFTGQPFGGNPVAVFPNAQGLTDFELQQIAREMNLSETVFVLPPTDEAAVVRLRIFTPTQEIPFAGSSGAGNILRVGPARVDCRHRWRHPRDAGMQHRPLSVEIHAREGQVTRVVMTQPKPLFLGSMDETEDLFHIAKALGLPKYQIVDTKAPVMVVSTGLPVVIVPVRALTAVRSIEPDASAIVEHVRAIRHQRNYGLYDHDGGGPCDRTYEDVCARDRNSRRPRHRECQRGYGRLSRPQWAR